MPRSVQVLSLQVKTQIPFRNSEITKEDTFVSPTPKFVLSVSFDVRIADTTKHFEMCYIWMMSIEFELG